MAEASRDELATRRLWLSAAVLCANTLFLLTPPVVGLLVLVGAVR